MPSGDTLASVRKYAIWGTPTSPEHEEWVRAVGVQFEDDGFMAVDDVSDADFVLNMFDAADPKAFRRASRGTYSAAFYELPEAPEDALKESYPMLVRTLSNVVLLRVPDKGVWFTTMERGTYHVPDDPAAIYERLEPLATSRLVIDNEWIPDLEPELWDGDEITADIGDAGRRLDELDLLPSPFPVEEYLSGRDLRHVMRLYSVGGLSYGNLSARKDETRFWMSASGVDKSQLESVGRDFLMVKDFDDDRRHDRAQRSTRHRASSRVGRRDRALDDLPGTSRRRGDPSCARVDGGDRRYRHQLSVRDAGARRRCRGSRRAGAGSGTRGDRTSKPRHHLHRRDPVGDPRSRCAEGTPPGPYDLSRSAVNIASAGATITSFMTHHRQIASITKSCSTSR